MIVLKTSGAGLYWPSPACDAITTMEPAPVIVRTLLDDRNPCPDTTLNATGRLVAVVPLTDVAFNVTVPFGLL